MPGLQPVERMKHEGKPLRKGSDQSEIEGGRNSCHLDITCSAPEAVGLSAPHLHMGWKVSTFGYWGTEVLREEGRAEEWGLNRGSWQCMIRRFACISMCACSPFMQWEATRRPA